MRLREKTRTPGRQSHFHRKHTFFIEFQQCVSQGNSRWSCFKRSKPGLLLSFHPTSLFRMCGIFTSHTLFLNTCSVSLVIRNQIPGPRTWNFGDAGCQTARGKSRALSAGLRIWYSDICVNTTPQRTAGVD